MLSLGMFNLTKKLLRDDMPNGGEIKIEGVKYLQFLHDKYSFGTIDNGYLRFTLIDKLKLIAAVKEDLGAHIIDDPYPERSRDNTAETHSQDKFNSYPVSRDFVLINTCNDFRLNGERYTKPPFTSLGLSVMASEILSVEHKQIVLVENLTLMANLGSLIMPDCLKEALWVYRGDVNPGQQTGMAYEFFRRFNTHELICFSDLDPAGIQIAITSGARYWLAPSDCQQAIKFKRERKLTGADKEWFAQDKARAYLENQTHLPKQAQSAFELMQLQRQTLQQEHMLAHKLPLALFDL